MLGNIIDPLIFNDLWKYDDDGTVSKIVMIFLILYVYIAVIMPVCSFEYFLLEKK